MKAPPSVPQNLIPKSFLNYGSGKQVPEKDCKGPRRETWPRQPSSYERRSFVPLRWSFCVFHHIYDHFTQSCNRLVEEIYQVIQCHHQVQSLKPREQPPVKQSCSTEPERKVNYSRIEETPRRPQEPPQMNQTAQRRAPANNLPHRGVINILSGSITDGDSNRARKAIVADWRVSQSGLGIGRKKTLSLALGQQTWRE